MKPGYVRKIFGGDVPESYTAAVQGLLEREKIDFSRRKCTGFPSFYTGKGETPVTCDSEVLSVGGIDNVDISVVQSLTMWLLDIYMEHRESNRRRSVTAEHC